MQFPGEYDANGVSPSGKARGFDPRIPRFESWHPSSLTAMVIKMSIVSTLTSSIRETKGTIACRKIRKGETQQTPGILYGDGQDSIMLNLPSKELDLLHAKHKLTGHLFELTVNKKKQIALVKAIQTHFIQGNVIHVDLQRVDKNHKITTKVPLVYANADESPASKKKGQITYAITELEITCLPNDLPDHITVDLAGLEIDQIIHRADLKLPKGVDFAVLTDEQHNPAVVTAHMPKGSAENSTEDAATSQDEANAE